LNDWIASGKSAAAGLDLFLPLYDPPVKLLGADRARHKLLEWMRKAGLIEPRVLDSEQPIFGKIVYVTARTGG
jgi:hypothetical protein